eukprot:COSAG01_NODE_16696_length_1214_cov_0.736323_1_plen_84_part_00
MCRRRYDEGSFLGFVREGPHGNASFVPPRPESPTPVRPFDQPWMSSKKPVFNALDVGCKGCAGRCAAPLAHQLSRALTEIPPM